MEGKMATKKDEKNMVKIKLFKDNNKYSNDVFVAVNGENYLIQRGKTVEVPDYVAEVLEHSMEQDEKTAELISSLSSKSE
jgi:hypothetical protein